MRYQFERKLSNIELMSAEDATMGVADKGCKNEVYNQMKYNHIVTGEFVDRPNRFIAHVMIDGRQETVHVKNTGRCRELLTKGARVYLEKSSNPQRKTLYDLVAVEKPVSDAGGEGIQQPAAGTRLINMDSQAPNKVVEEWLLTKALFPDLVCVRPETVYGNSRFDFYIETKTEKIFMEVKGVTLEEDGVVRFPDAPSQRAVKHVEELIHAQKEGYAVYVMFVIQMEGVKYFTPNRLTHPEFAEALEQAAQAGVQLLAYDCSCTKETMSIRSPVQVCLEDRGCEEGGQLCFGKNLLPLKTSLRFGDLAEIPKPLLKWYDSNRRILPWREKPEPYRVWVSEIMLQQTRVEAVKPYFERFMSSLPDIKSLAAAQEDVLLKQWEGLGYYNRVRNLQKAAVQIMEDYGGNMPDTYDELLKLKGIGSYTAGAIASIAFGQVHPAVDGNVLRVVSRIRMDESEITDPKVKSAVEKDLLAVMPEDRPGDFNQAMMEIGACVCIPNGTPHCGKCPLEGICLARSEGREMEFPRKPPRKQRKVEEKTILVIRDGNRAALKKRPDRGLLAGMYEFPSLEGTVAADEVISYLTEQGLHPLRIQPLEPSRHIFTHREWLMQGYMIRVDELEACQRRNESLQWLFVDPAETQEKYPVPAAFSAYTKYLSIKLGNEKFEDK